MSSKVRDNEAFARHVQERLTTTGHYTGRIDGWAGPATRRAFDAVLRPVVTHAGNPASLSQRLLHETLPWMREAWSVLGWHEVTDNGRLTKWLASGGRALGDPAKLPWCGDFVETCFARALPSEKLSGALLENPYWALNWNLFGTRCQPTYGAVATFKRPGGGHVGFLVGQDDTDYYVLGGNQGNAVSVAPLAKGRMQMTRWPLSYLPLPINLPRMTLDIARSTNEA